MVNICYEFGKEYGVTFNDEKTVCISFGKWSGQRKLFLGNKELEWKKWVKYMGNYIHESLDDEQDVMYKRGIFIQNMNKLLVNFGCLQNEIVCKLLNSYCTSFYCCHIWELESKCCFPMFTAWNKAIRRIWNLPNITHCNLLPYLSNSMNVRDQLICRFVKMFLVMYNSENPIMSYMAKRATVSSSGFIGRNLIYVKDLLNVNVAELSSINIKTLLAESYKSASEKCNATLIKELCAIRDGDYELSE